MALGNSRRFRPRTNICPANSDVCVAQVLRLLRHLESEKAFNKLLDFLMRSGKMRSLSWYCHLWLQVWVGKYKVVDSAVVCCTVVACEKVNAQCQHVPVVEIRGDVGHEYRLHLLLLQHMSSILSLQSKAPHSLRTRTRTHTHTCGIVGIVAHISFCYLAVICSASPSNATVGPCDVLQPAQVYGL